MRSTARIMPSALSYTSVKMRRPPGRATVEATRTTAATPVAAKNPRLLNSISPSRTLRMILKLVRFALLQVRTTAAYLPV